MTLYVKHAIIACHYCECKFPCEVYTHKIIFFTTSPVIIPIFWGSLLIFHTISAELMHSKILCFPIVISKWNKLDVKIKVSTSFSLFKASSLKMGFPHDNSTYKICNPIGISLLTCVCLGLSHLSDFLNQILERFNLF